MTAGLWWAKYDGAGTGPIDRFVPYHRFVPYQKLVAVRAYAPAMLAVSYGNWRVIELQHASRTFVNH